MPSEIERKFLLASTGFLKGLERSYYRQGYLPTCDHTVVRLRIVKNKAYLTIKGENRGIVRLEFEYEIPLTDAHEMMQCLCTQPTIEKYRYLCKWGGHTWEIDEFLGKNAGLFVAEVELTEENERVELPDWIGQEVSGDPKYYNSSLARTPFCEWPDSSST